MPAPLYPKRDIRRLLAVLAAVAELCAHATILRIALRTGLDRKTVTGLIGQASEQLGVVIAKQGPVYRIEHWGPVIKPSGARLALHGEPTTTRRKR